MSATAGVGLLMAHGQMQDPLWETDAMMQQTADQSDAVVVRRTFAALQAGSKTQVVKTSFEAAPAATSVKPRKVSLQSDDDTAIFKPRVQSAQISVVRPKARTNIVAIEAPVTEDTVVASVAAAPEEQFAPITQEPAATPRRAVLPPQEEVSQFDASNDVAFETAAKRTPRKKFSDRNLIGVYR